MKVEMKGRWGCGCKMAACELRQAEVETLGGGLVLIMRCTTHDLHAFVQLGVEATTRDGLDIAASRLMNLLHEESCR